MTTPFVSVIVTTPKGDKVTGWLVEPGADKSLVEIPCKPKQMPGPYGMRTVTKEYWEVFNKYIDNAPGNSIVSA